MTSNLRELIATVTYHREANGVVTSRTVTTDAYRGELLAVKTSAMRRRAQMADTADLGPIKVFNAPDPAQSSSDESNF